MFPEVAPQPLAEAREGVGEGPGSVGARRHGPRLGVLSRRVDEQAGAGCKLGARDGLRETGQGERTGQADLLVEDATGEVGEVGGLARTAAL